MILYAKNGKNKKNYDYGLITKNGVEMLGYNIPPKRFKVEIVKAALEINLQSKRILKREKEALAQQRYVRDIVSDLNSLSMKKGGVETFNSIAQMSAGMLSDRGF